MRGNQRTSGELSRKEGGKIFGSGSRAPIAITILVKKQYSKNKGQIYFHDIGDYLDREQKLKIIQRFKSINGIKVENKFQLLKPDENNDWVNQGDKIFNTFIKLGDKKDRLKSSIFQNYSTGVVTSRDAWSYNYSSSSIKRNIKILIDTYNKALIRKETFARVEKDPKLINWSRGLKEHFSKGKKLEFRNSTTVITLYRPFQKILLYLEPTLVEMMGKMRNIFPDHNSENLIITVSSVGSKSFSCLISSVIADLHLVESGAQCFPLRLYKKQDAKGDLFANQSDSGELLVSDGITDDGLQHFLNAYSGKTFRKEDLFYYIYGLLHSTDYREQFQNNLSKELPRIPAVKKFEDFTAFSKAGRKLGDLHVNYETVKPYPVTFKEGDLRLVDTSDPKSFYRVKKMKFANKQDKRTVIYNSNITMQDIPLEAYEYVVNAKSALAWVMERQCVKTDKASGIVNDANDYANETMNNPAYPLELFQRVITVSLETMEIVRSLPKLDI